MCPLPTAITSRVPAGGGSLTLSAPRGMHSRGRHSNDQARDGCWKPGTTSQVVKPEGNADLRHLDKVRCILGKARERPGGPNGALETVLFHGV